jgi:8-oxo-dGTP pyrophosphatase MutT (NUDIX family)
MHRNKIITLLQNYLPANDEELVYKEQMIQFANQHQDCFERSLAIGHFTASSWLLNHEGSKFLLTHHQKLNNWYQLGGHCDGDHDLLAVSIKEAQEESGINNITPVSEEIFDIDIHLIPANSKEDAHYHYDIRFLLQVASDEEIKISDESKDLKWFGDDYAKLPNISNSITRMYHKLNKH